MIELHRQTCQGCGSHSMRNLLYRESGVHDRVFVQCHDCGELVARYVLEGGGYYHHKKGFESFIRGLGRSGEFMSGKNMQNRFQEEQKDVLERFEKIKKILEAEGKTD